MEGKVVTYELICGIDFRFLTEEIAEALHRNRFKRIRLGWDGRFSDQFTIKKALGLLSIDLVPLFGQQVAGNFKNHVRTLWFCLKKRNGGLS